MKLAYFFHSDILHKYFSLYKVFSYILVFLLFIVAIFYSIKDIKTESLFLKKDKVNILKNDNKNRYKKIDSILLIEDIEKYLKSNNLNLLSLKLKKNSFYLQIEGSYKNSLKLIDFIEKYSGFLYINNISLINNSLKMSTILNLNITISKKYKKYKKINNLEIVEKKVVKNEKLIVKKKDFIKTKKLKLSAIIDKKALINNKWHKKDDLVGNSKILDIGRDFITLRKDSKLFYLRLYENELTR